MRRFSLVLMVAALCCTTASADSSTVTVPEASAELARPILDLQRHWRECSGHANVAGCDIASQNGRQSRIGKLLYDLTKNSTKVADEALVVLMCFNIGESQEEEDAVISRVKRMLPLLRKYQHVVPVVPARDYPKSMLNTNDIKREKFVGATQAIQGNVRGTWDDPKG